MSDLVARYVHEVGRYVPPAERAEIETELRSLIQDQLEDRFEGQPSEAEIAAVLKDLGDPRQIAASYGSEQYLIGPDLYGYMMTILRRGWLEIPALVVFLSLFGGLTGSDSPSIGTLLMNALVDTVEVVFLFSGAVVLIFALIQRWPIRIDELDTAFDPLALPPVDDPSRVDRFEAVFGAAIGALALLLFLYFLNSGGLTLNFNLNSPGDVILVPLEWLVLLILVVLGEVVVHLLALRRKHWSVPLWITETVLEVFGVIPFYFAVLEPLSDRLIAGGGPLSNLPLLASGAEAFAVVYAVITLVSRGMTLFRLWNYQHSSTAALPVQTYG